MLIKYHNINFEKYISVLSPSFFGFFPKDSPLGCVTLKKVENIKVVGCQRKGNKAGINVAVTQTTTESTTRTIRSTTVWTFTTTKNTRLPRPTFRKSTSLPPITYYDRDDNSTEVNATTPNPQMGEAAVSVPVITVTVAVPTSFMFLGGCFLYAKYRRGRGLIYGCLNRRQRYQTSPPPSPAHSTQTVVNITDDEENKEYELHHRNITTTNLDGASLENEVHIQNLGPNSSSVYSVA